MTNVTQRLHTIVCRTHSTLAQGELAADRGMMLICAALGLPGEAGEATDLVKKTVEQDRPLAREQLLKELGDVLYYCQLMAMALDTDLSAAVDALEAKLAKRYPQGFCPADAAARVDAAPEEHTDGGAGS